MARQSQQIFNIQFAFVISIVVTCFSMVLGQYMPSIDDARYNSETKSIEIDVNYGGGCAEHKFLLKMGLCRKTYPVRCEAKLFDLTTNDFCEAFIHRQVSISTQEVGLDSSYYKGATILIQGAGDSKVSVKLP